MYRDLLPLSLRIFMAFVLIWLLFSYTVTGQMCNTPSWLNYDDSQYLIVKTPQRTWSEARADCQSYDGDLAVITSHEQTSFLVGVSSPPTGPDTCYWIGLISWELDNNYTWIDGTPLRQHESLWDVSEPNYKDEGCACMKSFTDTSNAGHGKWNNAYCVHTRPYICERPRVLKEAWSDYPSVHYYMPSFTASYFDAREYCQQLGGTLAQLKTAEIDSNVTNSFSGTNFWFGLDALRKEGAFLWADGTSLRNSRFDRWLPGSPDNYQGCQFCVAHVNRGWDDMSCNLEFRFVCEKSKGCPPGKWNVPVCDRLCDNCYNGGECNPQTGSCICTPGFTGKNCLSACGDQRFGLVCEHVCGSAEADDSSCSGNKICPSDSNECSCLAGYTGVFCNETCPYGKFGSDCLQECHCKGKMPCDVFTGRCEGDCENEWSGEGCQVPSVCPTGFFGISCTDHCNCPGSLGCDKDSGFCTASEGQCEIGFTSHSVDMPESCSSFTGCFNLCSSTCHCRDGEDDCDSVSGSCRSGRCHPRWRGENCQIDRFQVTREKTHPGVAKFSCTFSVDSPTIVEHDYVKAAVTNFSVDNWKMVDIPPYNISATIFNFTFHIEDFPDGSPIYCFIGDPRNKSSEFAYVKLPIVIPFVLPELSSAPVNYETGPNHFVIRWKQWNSTADVGDGPVMAYKVYVYSENGSLVHSATVDPASGCVTMACDVLQYNVTGLEPSVGYIVRISVIREGFEGSQGQPVTIMTDRTENVNTTKDERLLTGSQSSCTTSWILFGVSVMGNVILAGVSVLFWKRQTFTGPPAAAASMASTDVSPQYENFSYTSKAEQYTYQDLLKDNEDNSYEEISVAR